MLFPLFVFKAIFRQKTSQPLNFIAIFRLCRLFCIYLKRFDKRPISPCFLECSFNIIGSYAHFINDHLTKYLSPWLLYCNLLDDEIQLTPYISLDRTLLHLEIDRQSQYKHIFLKIAHPTMLQNFLADNSTCQKQSLRVINR
jgi:hypothetical protein